MNKILKWELLGFLFIFIFGSIMHFAYSSTHSKIIGLFSPVNESIWEHLKLVLWPSLIFSLIEYSYLKDCVNNFITAKTISIIIAMILIITIFYLYTSILGQNLLFLDILTFALSILIGQLISFKTLILNPANEWVYALSAIILASIIIIFFIFTFSPPRLQIFMDPKSGNFGI